MNIAITGASGLIGQELTKLLETAGHRVLPVVRERNKAGIYWDLPANAIELEKLEGIDGIIHLAGANISQRWSEKVKRELYTSRIESTRLLVHAMQNLQRPPSVFICASAVGYYGSRGEELLTESSQPGRSYLSHICVDWENEARDAAEFGIRVVSARLGVVLTPAGGALKKMLPAFRLGIAGKLGTGQQYLSWISLRDAVSALSFCLTTDLSGPVNLVSPHPVTNDQLTKTLGKVLKRPTPFPVPAWALRLVAGELADELLLSSIRVVPDKLLKCGFTFSDPELEATLISQLSASQ